MRKLHMTPRSFSRKVQLFDSYRLLPVRGLASCADQAPGRGSYLEAI
jgi:hypothetical protein